MKGAVAEAPLKRIGRFHLRRTLGRGAQATVWLAHDERLDREVAVKLLDPEADTLDVSQWLNEARAVSRLSHPNIVPVFEADEAAGQPYLVFEFVDGPTLSAALRAKGAMSARDAALLTLGVLDALAAAHERGIVHRDLKPSNILIGSDGRPRVMDFGIAAHVDHGGDGRIVGTPGYMSPEAARGEAPVPAMDVFAAGMMLGQLLAGQPLLRESDPYRAIERVQNEDFALPDTVRVDDALRAIVARAVARDARQRYDGARSFHAALAAWLNPTDAPDPAVAEGNGTLEFLLRRMRHKRDFPALSSSIVSIQRMATSDTESLSSLSAEILKDVALTNKLLRMVNTVHFVHAGAGTISTVSRAVQLVGFAGIRNMALSVVLLEHMHDKVHASHIKEEFLRALMAGTLAAELSPAGNEGEEVFIGSMFQSLGRLLTQYYFPEEAQQIRQFVSASKGGATPDQAALRVIGLTFGDLGLGVARSWGLPESLQELMTAPEGVPPREATVAPERLRWLGRAANDITDALLQADAEALPAQLGRIAEAYGPAIGLSAQALARASATARTRMAQVAQAMNIQLDAGAPARRLIAEPVVPDEDTLAAHELHPTVQGELDAEDVLSTIAAPFAAQGPSAADILAAGVQDVTQCMVNEGVQLNEVLRIVLETMFRALQFQRVIFCLRDPRSDALTGRFGLGADVKAASAVFRVPMRVPAGAVPDLFTAVCAKGMDTMIADTGAPNIAQKLPAWYRQTLNAPSFLLLPMVLKGATLGLIYADRSAAHAIEVGERELALLRTLRNQAVMAFRQAERG